MTENKNYTEGQPIEPTEKTRIYVHKDVLKYLELYQEIGTISQLRVLKEERDKYFLEIQAYRAIGTIEEFKALKEKNEKAKAIDEFMEKVVAELHNFSLNTEPYCNEMTQEGICTEFTDCDYCKLQKAIDIVKKGGSE